MRHGRCAFCTRAAREVAAVRSWQVVERRRIRESEMTESVAVCADHASRLRHGRLLLKDERAYELQSQWQGPSAAPTAPDDSRQAERRYLREASGLNRAASGTGRCIAMTPTGTRCRRRAASGSDFCPRHALQRRRGIPVIRAD
jgi:hypothetical protein